jgi:hypothetical protein
MVNCKEFRLSKVIVEGARITGTGVVIGGYWSLKSIVSVAGMSPEIKY